MNTNEEKLSYFCSFVEIKMERESKRRKLTYTTTSKFQSCRNENEKGKWKARVNINNNVHIPILVSNLNNGIQINLKMCGFEVRHRCNVLDTSEVQSPYNLLYEFQNLFFNSSVDVFKRWFIVY